MSYLPVILVLLFGLSSLVPAFAQQPTSAAPQPQAPDATQDPNYKKCEALEEKIEKTVCAGDAKNSMTKSPLLAMKNKLCDGTQLTSQNSITSYGKAGGKVDCMTEKKVAEITKNPACSNVKGDATADPKDSCHNGARSVPFSDTLARLKQLKETAGVQCFEPAGGWQPVDITYDVSRAQAASVLLAQQSKSIDVTLCADDVPAITQAQQQLTQQSASAVPATSLQQSAPQSTTTSGSPMGQSASQSSAIPAASSTSSGSPQVSQPLQAPTSGQGTGPSSLSAATTGQPFSQSSGSVGSSVGGPLAAATSSGTRGTNAPVPSRSLADSSEPVTRSAPARTYTAPTYSSPSPVASGGGGTPSFFSQLLSRPESQPVRAASVSQVAPRPTSYPVQQYGLQPAALVSPVQIPVTQRPEQPSSLAAIQKIAREDDLAELTRLLSGDPTAVPAGATSVSTVIKSPARTKDEQLLALLSESPSVEELVRAENKKLAVQTRPIADVPPRPSLADSARPATFEQKQAEYIPPTTLAQNSRKEQTVLEQLGIKVQPLDTQKPLTTSRTSLSTVRSLVARELASLNAAYTGDTVPTTVQRDTFASELTALASRVESAAYGTDYETSVRVLALAKLLEDLSYRIARGDSTPQVRSELATVRESLARLVVRTPPAPVTLASLPQRASEWHPEHFHFYTQHITRLQQKATTDKAKTLFNDALRVLSFAASAQATAPTQWDLQSYIDTARSKVSLAQSLERDAARARLTQPAPASTQPSFFKSLLNAFGF